MIIPRPPFTIKAPMGAPCLATSFNAATAASFNPQRVTTSGTRYKYVGSGLSTVGFAKWSGTNWATGWVPDAVYSPVVGSSLQLTTGWSVVAGIDHHWDPHWKTSLYGTYGDISFNGAATALFNGAFCITAACAAIGPDFQHWQIGSRTVWTPVQNLDLSVDVMYNNIQTAYSGIVTTVPAVKAPGPGQLTDEGWWQVIVRAQRNFYP